MLEQQDLSVPDLGDCPFDSPLGARMTSGDRHFISDAHRIRYAARLPVGEPNAEIMTFEEAGPRRRVFFEPSRTTAAIVTCGGLSPGLNNVIRSAFHELKENYGVARVLGIRNGYLGLTPDSGRPPMALSHEIVDPIDKLGGTVLGTSRGPQDPAVMADFIAANRIDILLTLGGDGTQRGAHALSQELVRRNARVAVVGIPKTIDNDVPFVRLSFGYGTALEKAAEVIRGAHVEARDAVNGIGLVKLMGRHAGFIAAGASVVSQEVDFTLVPEVPVPLDGEQGFLRALEARMHRRGHAVIVVAEGACQGVLDTDRSRRDASGNVLPDDVGVFLRERILAHFGSVGLPISMKYLDPSYHIRSVPANVYDRFLCDQMARHAVHAAMAGKTGVMIGQMHDHYINVPIPVVVGQTKRLDPAGDIWRAVLASTGQPDW